MKASFQILSLCVVVGAVAACGGSGTSATSASSSNGSSSSGSSSSSSGTSTGGSSTSGSTVDYASAYMKVKWGNTVKVSFSNACTMNLVTTGLPNHNLDAYYLRPPTTNAPTVLATTPSGLQLSLQANTETGSTTSLSYNICPTQASSTTVANLGTIGTMISGAALFNAAEGNGTTPAMADNVSYQFTDSNGKQQTASFIDACNGHFTPSNAGSTYHYHGVSSCVTSQVDTAGGPSHIIGIALDGYPVYGGRDINGNVIALSQLDSCNGINSATPEFPNGAYHYVLPEGVTSLQSSLRCYTGKVSNTLVAQAKAQGICVTPTAQIAQLTRSQTRIGTRDRRIAVSLASNTAKV